jgi:3,4-dihydroxy 2-butanone 4-phosphate synthase/GTP cyclohydrolase II
VKLVERVGDARLPTAHGDFRIVSYRAHDGHEHVAVIEGEPLGREVLTRVHSECLTGDVLGSLKCDCGAQLAAAMRAVRDSGRGVVVYLRGHEGRGIGLANKIKAYELQDGGLDTVDANTVQGLPVDSRRYDVAAAILRDLGVESVRLMSNNPLKASGLEEHGVAVDGVEPIRIDVHPESEAYLRTKVDRLGHLAAN